MVSGAQLTSDLPPALGTTHARVVFFSKEAQTRTTQDCADSRAVYDCFARALQARHVFYSPYLGLQPRFSVINLRSTSALNLMSVSMNSRTDPELGAEPLGRQGTVKVKTSVQWQASSYLSNLASPWPWPSPSPSP